ncbi:uncharacterized protein LOC118180184 [Stegodyphus dumicola]|uniref:uncharacterized protein LOC118180184 n=1 Tax=Stegodyphus dumicola TaxID=202533 RepID=UPI0015A959A2|nr:uncharacterized protein LOC118180184 [Stegodyphus dumicola]
MEWSSDVDCQYKPPISSECLLKICHERGLRNYTVFLKGIVKNINANNPKILKDEISSKVALVKNIDFIKIIRYGRLLINTSVAECAWQVLNISELHNIKVFPMLAMSELTSKFLLSSIPVEVELSELANELNYNNEIEVLNLRRFLAKSPDSNKKPPERVLVTIARHHLPEYVKICLTRHRITRFYDNPRQCPQCLRFGHGIKSCRGLVRRSKCSENHTRAQCQSEQIKCALCSNSHEASSKNCPKYIEEGNILKYSADHHVPVVEARHAVAN